MHHVIPFGKIAHNKSGRKINALDITIQYKDGILSVIGNVWNGAHSTPVLSGPIIEEIILPMFPLDRRIKVMIDIQRQYHLNDNVPDYVIEYLEDAVASMRIKPLHL